MFSALTSGVAAEPDDASFCGYVRVVLLFVGYTLAAVWRFLKADLN